MPTTTAEIREVQMGLSARNPKFPPRGSVVDSAMPVPSSATDGEPTQLTTGRNAVYSLLLIEAAADITYDFVWWGYNAAARAWAQLDGGARTGQVDSWMQIVPTGPVDRLYCQITNIVISGASPGVYPRVAPCDPSAS